MKTKNAPKHLFSMALMFLVVGSSSATLTSSSSARSGLVFDMNSQSCSFQCSIIPPDQNPQCGSSDVNTFTATVSGGQPPLILTWSIDDNGLAAGWMITGGQGTNMITYLAGCSGSATFTLIVNDANGCQSTCSITVSCSPRLISATSLIRPSNGSEIAASRAFRRSSTCEEVPDLCSLGQGTYGNRNGRFNGESIEEIIARLITADRPLVIGVPERSITFMNGSEQCIIQAMPAASTSRTLPPDLGNLTVDNGCAIPSSLVKNGRFKNVLLGQTIALLLNTRLDETLHRLYLGGLASCNIFGTQKALPGPDGLLGTSDDIPDPGPDLVPGTGDEPILTFTFPVSVINAMVALGLSQDVDGLVTLANRALGGDTNLGDTSLSDINDAVETINRAFDGCRIPIGALCSQLPAQRIYPNINSRLKDGLK